MMHRIPIFLALVLAVMSPIEKAHAAEPIDVLVALAPDSFTQDAAFWSLSFQNQMNFALDNTGIGSLNVRVRPYLLIAGLPSTDPVDAVPALDALTDDVDFILSNARDTAVFTLGLDVTSYDIVVVVVDDLRDLDDPTNPIACGAAYTLYSASTGTIPVNNAAESRFVILLSDHTECRFKIGRSFVHELDHLFGGDHQIAINGQEVDTEGHTDDEDLVRPAAYPANHPIVHLDEDGEAIASTAMVGRLSMGPVLQYSSNNGANLYTPPGFSAGNETADMRTLIVDMWDGVAAYRPLPPLPTCGSPNIIVTPLACNNYNNRTFLITGSLPGYQITSARYEVKVGSYGIWQIILDGILSCPLFNSGFGFYVKMFFTTPQGTAVCQKYVSFPSCGGGGGGDPPIQPW